MIVIKNLLAEKDHQYLQSLCQEKKYRLTGSVLNAKKNNFLSSSFLEEDEYRVLFEEVLKKTSLKGDISLVKRAYINCAPAGKFHGGDWHKDDRDITILYYPFGWDQKFGGRTVFSNNKAVDYVANSVVCFPTDLAHKAEPHRAPAWRFTIALKTTLEW